MKHLFFSIVVLSTLGVNAQLNPAITNWMINSTNIMGSHYVNGNSTPINDNVLANVQTVQYSSNWVYVSTKGIPAFVTGPFLDGNPSFASNQNAIFKMPLYPTENTGVSTPTNGGNIGIFINGVALFDYRDGVSYDFAAGEDQGGPSGGMGDNVWNRDAIVAEMGGFDCAKAHPAMGNYHHHQNPSAFNLDLTTVSNICDLYPSDGLYAINASQHSPLIGFAYDGFPIYGAIGHVNSDGTGGVARIRSSYVLRNITVRTHYADGTDVIDGPPVNAENPLGKYREDYEYIDAFGDLDEHNGRFCVTPEYPDGIYAYFCTVDENYNSAYPYAVGPTFFGNKVASKVTSISETVTPYTPSTSNVSENTTSDVFNVYPNPVADVLIIQASSILMQDASLQLVDMNGRVVAEKAINQGSTLTYFDVATLYNGTYLLTIQHSGGTEIKKVIVGD